MPAGFDVSIAHRRVIGEREIHRVGEAAIEAPIEAAEVSVGDHQVEGEPKNPNLYDMGADGAEDAYDDSYSVLHSEPGYGYPE